MNPTPDSNPDPNPSPNQTHWQTIYQTKTPQEVSWTQPIPQTSLDFIHSFALQKTDSIIDIGAGESLLVDFLVEEGFTSITLLDISQNALQKTRERLIAKFGEKVVQKVTFIVSDILAFQPQTTFALWHDRATFHFLTDPSSVATYVQLVEKYATKNVILATFSKEGAKKCSGLEVCQYDEQSLTKKLEDKFKKITCLQENHTTPFATQQNFLFCSFEKIV